jgi:SAM-dependent methyltransferase
MRRGLFVGEEFDAVCMFQVLDHLPDPNEVLAACMEVLRPGGVLLCLNHNIEAISARLLRERSPIVDVEHTYLYSPSTMKLILEKNGYRVVELGSARNVVSIEYLNHLMPLPRQVKSLVAAVSRRTGVSHMTVRAPLGNLYAIAQKPI